MQAFLRPLLKYAETKFLDKTLPNLVLDDTVW